MNNNEQVVQILEENKPALLLEMTKIQEDTVAGLATRDVLSRRQVRGVHSVLCSVNVGDKQIYQPGHFQHFIRSKQASYSDSRLIFQPHGPELTRGEILDCLMTLTRNLFSVIDNDELSASARLIHKKPGVATAWDYGVTVEKKDGRLIASRSKSSMGYDPTEEEGGRFAETIYLT